MADGRLTQISEVVGITWWVSGSWWVANSHLVNGERLFGGASYGLVYVTMARNDRFCSLDLQVWLGSNPSTLLHGWARTRVHSMAGHGPECCFADGLIISLGLYTLVMHIYCAMFPYSLRYVSLCHHLASWLLLVLYSYHPGSIVSCSFPPSTSALAD